jgi:hypothetical protein
VDASSNSPDQQTLKTLSEDTGSADVRCRNLTVGRTCLWARTKSVSPPLRHLKPGNSNDAQRVMTPVNSNDA